MTFFSFIREERKSKIIPSSLSLARVDNDLIHYYLDSLHTSDSGPSTSDSIDECAICLTHSLLNPSSPRPGRGWIPSGGGMLAWVHAFPGPAPLFDSGSRLKVLTGLQNPYA
jgi:hypothetical protein